MLEKNNLENVVLEPLEEKNELTLEEVEVIEGKVKDDLKEVLPTVLEEKEVKVLESDEQEEKAMDLETRKRLFPENFLTEDEKDNYARENLALIYYVAKYYQAKATEDELISVGLIGFTKALNAYDRTKLTKFSTYAVKCIHHEILFHLRKEKKHLDNVISVNTILSQDKNGHALSLEDTILNDKAGQDFTEITVLIKDEINLLNKAIENLDELERFILIHRYGLFKQKKMTQKELAEKIQMSQANISKKEQIILIKLRQILRDKYKLTETTLKI